jgi:hypothetical protein
MIRQGPAIHLTRNQGWVLHLRPQDCRQESAAGCSLSPFIDPSTVLPR